MIAPLFSTGAIFAKYSQYASVLIDVRHISLFVLHPFQPLLNPHFRPSHSSDLVKILSLVRDYKSDFNLRRTKYILLSCGVPDVSRGVPDVLR